MKKVNGMKKVNVKIVLMLLVIFMISTQSNKAIASGKISNDKKRTLNCLELKNGYELTYEEYLVKLKEKFKNNDFNNIKEILDKKELEYNDSYKNFNNICAVEKNTYLFFRLFAPHIGRGIYKLIKIDNNWVEESICYESDYIKLMNDKKNNKFLFVKGGNVKNGISSFGYSLVDLENYKSTRLLHSISDGESGLCGRESLNIEIGINLTYKIKDSNNDGHEDIVFSVKEQNCKTKNIKTYKKIFYATDDSFKEKINNK